MLCEQPTSSDEAMPSIEIEDRPEDIAVHLIDMLNSESPKNRKTWLQRLDGCKFSTAIGIIESEVTSQNCDIRPQKFSRRKDRDSFVGVRRFAVQRKSSLELGNPRD
jgi:hypothetical protein